MASTAKASAGISKGTTMRWSRKVWSVGVFPGSDRTMGKTESPDANVPSAERFWGESLTSVSKGTTMRWSRKVWSVGAFPGSDRPMVETESPDANVPSAEMFWVESLTSRPRMPGEACDLTGPVELPAASFFPSAEDIKSTQRGRKKPVSTRKNPGFALPFCGLPSGQAHQNGSITHELIEFPPAGVLSTEFLAGLFQIAELHHLPSRKAPRLEPTLIGDHGAGGINAGWRR